MSCDVLHVALVSHGMGRRIPRRLAHEPKALREARRRAGRSQAWLAEHLGCSRSLVVEMEAGTRSARAERLPRIAALLGCAVEDIAAPAGDQEARA